MNPLQEVEWGVDWAWGIPLTALTCVIHVLCMALFTSRVEYAIDHVKHRRHFSITFSWVMALAVTLVTALHIVEGAIWAIAYRWTGAIADNRSAMLYSLGALTTYGDTNIHVEYRWKMLGALEALNGMLLFGLTTAFLFAMIQRVWPASARYTSRSSQLKDGLDGRKADARPMQLPAGRDTMPAPASPAAPTRDPGAP
jgi:hypothetical protein